MKFFELQSFRSLELQNEFQKNSSIVARCKRIFSVLSPVQDADDLRHAVHDAVEDDVKIRDEGMKAFAHFVSLGRRRDAPR